MRHSIQSARLKEMAPARREQEIAALVEATKAPPNGELQEIDAKIQAFERKFAISSGALRRELDKGKRSETWEICEWLLLLDLRDHIASFAPRT